ncbi:MAG: TspO/MBR family protein, partial [Verrucomicrobiota bacterium]
MPFWLKILVSVIAVEILGGLGAVFTTSSIETWYAELTKPPGNPPNWLFAPVWTALYALIGIAFARVWHLGEAGPRKQAAMTWFTIQLVLNLAWTPVFFGA